MIREKNREYCAGERGVEGVVVNEIESGGLKLRIPTHSTATLIEWSKVSQ